MLFLHDYFSRFHKIKTRTSIKNLRQSFLNLNVFYNCEKFYNREMNIERDISVQKKVVKKSIFKFSPSRFVTFLPIII